MKESFITRNECTINKIKNENERQGESYIHLGSQDWNNLIGGNHELTIIFLRYGMSALFSIRVQKNWRLFKAEKIEN